MRQGGRRSWGSGAVVGLLAALCAFVPVRSAADCSAPNPEARNRVALPTVFGDICLDLLDEPDEAPETVANFLAYYDRGDFVNSFFHRLIPGFVLQGGGFRWTPADGYERIPQDPPVENDPDPVNRSNVRGTVAMAKIGGQEDSATNQFFINLADNSGPPASLDTQNGGFTVFARVVAEDMPVVDQIAALHTEYGPYALSDPLRNQFTNLPVLELLERDPAGYGCVIVFPDPTNQGQPRGMNNCMGDMTAFNESIQLTIAAMEPQVPERLVLVPEPAAPLLLAAGAALLGGLARGARAGR
jgi:cyclophilin family peptidyl-prolyl cis-trans isomerase